MSIFTTMARPFSAMVTRIIHPRHTSAAAKRAIAEASSSANDYARHTIDSSVYPTDKELKTAKDLHQKHGIRTVTFKRVEGQEPKLYVNGDFISKDDPRYEEYEEEANSADASLTKLKDNIDGAMEGVGRAMARAFGCKLHKTSGPFPVFLHRRYPEYPTCSHLYPRSYCVDCIPRCQTKNALAKAKAMVTKLEAEIADSK